MNDFLPRGFLTKERARFFTPDRSFPRRVMAQVGPVKRPAYAVWDLVPGFAGPMIAVMTMILAVIVGVQIFYTQPPPTGIVDAYLEPDETAADRWLYHGVDLPQDDAWLLEISLVGELQ